MRTDRQHTLDLDRLKEKLAPFDIAMLTTVDEDGHLRSRPMYTLKLDEEGALWFFTMADSPKVDELTEQNRVNLSYADQDDQTYVSISGVTQILKDREKIEDFWSPVHKAWIPEGPDDPDLALLKVNIEQAEYWDETSNRMERLVRLAKTLVSGERYQAREKGKVENPDYH
jgi:general stress protein 26